MSADAPRLRADLAIVEQTFRDEQGFIVKDPLTHSYYRFRPIEVRVMRAFDGASSVEEIAAALGAEGVRLSTAAVDGFARKLSQLGLLERTLREKATQQLERLRAERGRQRSLFRGELFRMRFPFGDPDAFLTRTYPYVRWCFTPAFVLVSIACFVAYAGINIGRHDAYLAEIAPFSPARLTLATALIAFLTFAALTFIHEMAHAYACKHFGGEVHEMGFMLLFFMPAFYANVNDAWSFPERRARLWVTAAGAWIELVVTGLCAIAWLVIAPGSILSQVAVFAMLVGGLANILTNVNPLLPLDGYFALGDWLAITNLRQRSKEHTRAWLARHLLRSDVPEPPASPRERRILLVYGVLSGVYIALFLWWLGSMFVGWAYRTLGFLAGALALGLVLFPMRRGIRDAVRATVQRVVGLTRGSRLRRAGIAVLAALLLAAVIPVGMTAKGRFVVAPVTTFAATAPSTGAVSAVFVRTGDQVAPGAPLVRVANFSLAREQVMLGREADSIAFGARVARARRDPGEETVLAADAERAEAMAGRARAQAGELRVRSLVGGTVVTPYPERLLGQGVRFGDTLLVVSDLARLEAIVRVRGAGAAGVREGQRVRLVSYADVARPVEGEVATVSPVAGDTRAVEARVRLDSSWPAGATGEARITWRRTTLLGALVWAVRSRVRGDLLL